MYHDKMFCLTPTIYFVLRQAFASTYLVKSFASERSKVHCTKSGDHLTYWPNKSYQSLVLLFEILTSEHLCFAKLWKRGIEFPCWGNVGNLWKRARFALNADLLQISILKFPRYFSTFNLFATVSRRIWIWIQGILSIKKKREKKWPKKSSFIFHLIYLLGWMGMWVKSVGLSSHWAPFICEAPLILLLLFTRFFYLLQNIYSTKKNIWKFKGALQAFGI